MKRIHELAKDLGLSSRALLRLLRRLGFKVTSPMAPVSTEMIDACKAQLRESKESLKLQEIEKRKIRAKVRKSSFQIREERRLREKERAEKKLRETMTKIEMGERAKKYKKELKPEEKIEKKIRLSEFTSVRELASFLGLGPLDLISDSLKLGVIVTINQRLDFDTASSIAHEYGFETELIPTYKEQIEEIFAKPEPRPPVVTVMGHVDHGKTTLLDYIRHTNVVSSEIGEITQHIGAYKVKIGNNFITFIDTPGHHAFTAMRTRGTKVTDIVVLVIAADEGVKPQTIEAINHSRDAGVPIVIAINKIDKPNTNPDHIEKQLLEYKLVTEKHGGDTLCTKVSAKTGEGVKELLESILMQTELLELHAPKETEAKGSIIESSLDRGKGPVATAIIFQGTLKIGNSIIAGNVSGKVRALYNEWGKSKSKAFPSDPIQIVGLDDIPQVGDNFRVIRDTTLAREISKERKESIREEIERWKKPAPILDIEQHLEATKIKELKLIIKGDVAGTAEALADSITHLTQEEAKVNIIHQAPGEINESDVLLAAASGAIIIGYNTRQSPAASQLAREKNVQIRTYNIIYEAIEDIELALKGLLPPKIKELLIGKAQVKQAFKISGVGFVAGCIVIKGKIIKGEKARVKREEQIIYEGTIQSLKRLKDTVTEVQEGLECGIGFEKSIKLVPGDIIEVYQIKEIEEM